MQRGPGISPASSCSDGEFPQLYSNCQTLLPHRQHPPSSPSTLCPERQSDTAGQSYIEGVLPFEAVTETNAQCRPGLHLVFWLAYMDRTAKHDLLPTISLKSLYSHGCFAFLPAVAPAASLTQRTDTVRNPNPRYLRELWETQ